MNRNWGEFKAPQGSNYAKGSGKGEENKGPERNDPGHVAGPDQKIVQRDVVRRSDQTIAPWQCLNFLPEPQGQALLRVGLPQVVGSFSSKPSTAAPGASAVC